MNLHQELARGEFAKTLRGLLCNFTSSDFALKIGVIVEAKSAAVAKMESEVGESLWRLVITAVGHLSVTNLSYTDAPPHMFTGLVDPDRAVVERTLRQCQVSWEVLCKLEAQAVADRRCAAWVKDLLFPSLQWVREVFRSPRSASAGCPSTWRRTSWSTPSRRNRHCSLRISAICAGGSSERTGQASWRRWLPGVGALGRGWSPSTTARP